MFEGVAIMQLRDGKIAEYHEVANTAPAFVDIEVRAGAHREDRCQAGRGAEGAAGDEAALAWIHRSHVREAAPVRKFTIYREGVWNTFSARLPE